MSCIQSSRLNAEKCSKITDYLNELIPSKRNSITLSKISEATGINMDELGIYIDSLVDNHVLIPHFGLRCPECGMIYEYFDQFSDIDMTEKYFCHYCEENKNITIDDIIVLFSFRNPNDFFRLGQNNLNEGTIISAQDIDEKDNIVNMAEICNSIQKLTDTVGAIHDENQKKREEEEAKKGKMGKIKALIKCIYVIVVLVVLLWMVRATDIEQFGVSVEIIVFIFSFVSAELLDYILEKCF